MNCMNCGRSLDPSFKYCPECATLVVLIRSENQVEEEPVPVPQPQMKQYTLKRILLITMIVTLSISGLMGIGVILFGSGNEIEGQILLTTTAIGGFSLLGLCCSPVLERRSKRSIIALLGIVSSAMGLLLSLVMIWFDVGGYGTVFEIMIKWLLGIIVLSVGIAHICLLLLIKQQKLSVWVVTFTTVILIMILIILLVVYIFEGFGYNAEWYFKSIAVLAILDVLGTIVSPIVGKISKK